MGTACYGAALVGGAHGGAWAAEAGGVEGRAGVVVCCARVAVLTSEELEVAAAIFEDGGVVCGGELFELGDGGLEGREDVGRREGCQRREQEGREVGSHI